VKTVYAWQGRQHKSEGQDNMRRSSAPQGSGVTNTEEASSSNENTRANASSSQSSSSGHPKHFDDFEEKWGEIRAAFFESTLEVVEKACEAPNSKTSGGEISGGVTGGPFDSNGRLPTKQFVQMYDKVYQLCTKGDGSEHLYKALAGGWVPCLREKYRRFSSESEASLMRCGSRGGASSITNTAKNVLESWLIFSKKFITFTVRVAVVFSYLDRFYTVSNNVPHTTAQGKLQLLVHFVLPSLPLVADAFILSVDWRVRKLKAVMDRDIPRLGMIHRCAIEASQCVVDYVASQFVDLLVQLEPLCEKYLRGKSLLRAFGKEIESNEKWRGSESPFSWKCSTKTTDSKGLTTMSPLSKSQQCSPRALPIKSHILNFLQEKGLVKHCLPSWGVADEKQKKTTSVFEKVEGKANENSMERRVHQTDEESNCDTDEAEIGRRGETKARQPAASDTVVPSLSDVRNQDEHLAEGGQHGRVQLRCEEGKAEGTDFTLN